MTTSIPKRSNGRLDWNRFYNGMVAGQSFILPDDIRACVCSRAVYYGMRIQCRSNRDGTFTMTVNQLPGERETILKALSSMPITRLSNLYQSCRKFGYLP